ncbi:MAG: penicillin amidase [Chitinophagales bacterium]|nr:MAG: penicillin amidase [Chitinophagales bacterium]
MRSLLLCVLCLIVLPALARIKPENITIVRDSFGVPHIFAKTDSEVAYGLAWTHAEDDFLNIQYNLLAAKAMLGEVLGKEGVLFDYALQFLGIDTLVATRYDQAFSSDFKKILEGYAQGINDYAAAHPGEVLLKKALPFTGKDVIAGYTLQASLMAGIGMALRAIRNDRIAEYYSVNETGSNAIAIAPFRTTDQSAYLLVNSHQPIEGRFAWYEAHLNSEEGWNIIGGLFPGGVTCFVGTNPYLGWAHTNNFHTFGDIYQLQINPENKNQYRYDDQWRDFEVREIRLRIKLGFLKIRVKRKILVTEFGPVFENKKTLYALRFPGYMDLRAAEQWYRMNKATSFAEFEKALKTEALPMFNTIYADREGNIFFRSGGQLPRRNPALTWEQPITSSSSEYRWTQLLSYEELPSILNPECGYVFNANQTPLVASGDACDWEGDFVGLQRFSYNRGERFDDLLGSHEGPFSWEDFHRIKFDKSYARNGSYMRNFGALYTLDENKYPDIADAIRKLKNWNLEGTVDNQDAALALVVHDMLIRACECPFALLMIRKKKITEEEAVEAIRKAKKFLLKTHGSIDIPLGDVQRHIRGNINIPASGLREVPRAADARLYDKKRGQYRIEGGDGYIQMVRFYKDRVELHTINAYGASARPESPHYTDQMVMFQNEQFKRMTFDKNEIFSKALRIYHPGK